MLAIFRSRNVHNFCFLAMAQGANALLPLVIFPYLLWTVGAENYSEVVIAETWSLVALSVVIFSFDITGVTQVIQVKDSPSNTILSEVVFGILFTRLFLFFCCLFVLCIVGFFIKVVYFYLLLFWMLVPLSYIFQSSYFYLGIERNGMMAFFMGTSRLISLLLVFLLVRKSADFIIVPLIVGGCYFVGSFTCFIFMCKKYKLKWTRVSLNKIISYITQGRDIFFGNLSVILYRDANLIILSFMVKNSVVISSFSVANKAINALQASIRPLNQLFFPKIIKELQYFSEPSKINFSIIKRKVYPQLLILLSLVFVLYMAIFLVLNTRFITQNNSFNYQILSFFSIMIFAMFLGVANFMFGSAGLNFLNAKKYLSVSMMISGVITVLVGFVLVKFFGGYGASLNLLFGEGLLLFFIIKKYCG